VTRRASSSTSGHRWSRWRRVRRSQSPPSLSRRPAGASGSLDAGAQCRVRKAPGLRSPSLPFRASTAPAGQRPRTRTATRMREASMRRSRSTGGACTRGLPQQAPIHGCRRRDTQVSGGARRGIQHSAEARSVIDGAGLVWHSSLRPPDRDPSCPPWDAASLVAACPQRARRPPFGTMASTLRARSRALAKCPSPAETATMVRACGGGGACPALCLRTATLVLRRCPALREPH
jgi:hypothetical protein